MIKRIMFLAATVLIALLAACAQPAAPEAMKTADAMKASEATKTHEAMVAADAMKAAEAMKKGTPDAMPKGDAMMKLPDQMFAAHFTDSAPKHGDAFAKVPEKVVINFNFTLGDNSAINVAKDDKPVTAGSVVVASNKLSMSATLPKDAGDGLYVVKYKACWPDKSCHDGLIAFKVDSKMGKLYTDMTGKAEVTIHLKDVQFNPGKVIVSQGTRVTWVNDDPYTHFVNSDPHPSHNALPALNTLELEKGDSFAFTFDQPGEIAYHCSAHVPDGMIGRVVVDG